MDDDDAVREREVPDRFNESRDDAGKPQRELHDFVVTQLPPDDDDDDHPDPAAAAAAAAGAHTRRANAMVSICAIDDSADGPAGARKRRPIVARGTLKAVDGSGVEVLVQTGPLNEWCIDYGLLTIWVETDLSWYKMNVPAKAYEKMHEVARRRMEICSRLYVLSNEFAPLTFPAALGYMAHPYLHMRGYTEKDIVQEKRFILEQADQIGDDIFKSSPFLKELKKKGGAGGAGAQSRKTDGKAGDAKRPDKKSSSNKQAKSKKAAAEPAVTWAPGREDGGVSASQTHMLKRIDGILAKLVKDKRALMFGEPVDPVRHGCANYFDVVKNPMDLGTIQTKLTRKFYATVDEVMADIRQVWTNCRLYNPPGSPLVKYADELERKVERQVYNAETAEIAAATKRAAAGGHATTPTSQPSPKGATAVVAGVEAQSVSPATTGAAAAGDQGEPAKDGSGGALKRKRSTSTYPSPAPSPPGSAPTSAQKPPIPPGSTKSAPQASPAIPAQPADFKGSGKPCANPRCSDREARLGSKYCTDECGMEVATARLQSMIERGTVPDSIKVL